MKRMLVIGLVAVLTACATPYQPYSYFSGGGYKDIQLSENSFRVTFEANGYTDKTTATDLALLRASELTLKSGFKYFIIILASDNGSNVLYTTPTTTNFQAASFGNNFYGTARTSGGQPILIDLPAPSITILCFKEKPNANGMVYDANIVSQSMRAQYNIN